MTTADYLALPLDDRRTELVYGELIVSPRPSDEHNDAFHYLGDLLSRWARHYKLGKVSFEIDMVLDASKDLVYAPDLLFLSTEHAARRKRGKVFGPADLCVEVLSPSERPSLRGRKYADYERYGIPWYWIIQPDPELPSLEENELVDGKYVCRTEVSGNDWFEPGLFPGLVFRLPPLLAAEGLKDAVKGKAKKLI